MFIKCTKRIDKHHAASCVVHLRNFNVYSWSNVEVKCNTAKLSSSVIPTLDLTEMRCKSYYKILNGNSVTVPTGIKNCKNNFPNYFKDWRKKFAYIYIDSQRIIN